MSRPRSKLDIIGKKFNRLLVLREDGKTRFGKKKFLCLCDCGNHVSVIGSQLLSGNTKSCTCLQKQKAFAKCYKHGLKDTPEYMAWVNMRNRCYYKNNNHYHRYGGRGITVCKRWLGENGFINFYNDMGKRPTSEHSLDRKNNDKNYTKSNCRWATEKIQQRNKSVNVWLEANGIRMLQREWAKRWNVTDSLIRQHFKYGRSFKEIFEYFEGGECKKRNFVQFEGKMMTITEIGRSIGAKKATFYNYYVKLGSIEKAVEHWREKAKFVKSKLI